MARFDQYDIIELTEDFKEEDLPSGTRGTILEVYDLPGRIEEYEVEVSGPDGRNIAQFVASPEPLRSSTIRC